MKRKMTFRCDGCDKEHTIVIDLQKIAELTKVTYEISVRVDGEIKDLLTATALDNEARETDLNALKG